MPDKKAADRIPKLPEGRPLGVLDGKYTLRRRIGMGVAGNAFEAEHVVVGKRVAIKLLNPLPDRDETIRVHFADEARAAAQIGHDNVAEIIDFGVSKEGSPYLVMELLAGETLEELLARRGALPPAFACELMVQVLAGLGAAHALGIVHRDLKPANIIITYPRPDQPLVKIVDFGIATDVHDRARRNEGVLGTPAYMPPEQALGKPVDVRADLYAAGVILYEMLCGETPFVGTAAEVLRDVMVGKWRPLESVNPAVPQTLTAAVVAAMTMDPADRVRSAYDFARRLNPYLSNAPPRSVPDGPILLSEGAPSEPQVVSGYPGTARALRDFPSRDLARVAGKPHGEPLADALLQSPIIPRAPAAPKIQAFGSTRELERWDEAPVRTEVSELPPEEDARDSLLDPKDDKDGSTSDDNKDASGHEVEAWHRAAWVTALGIGVGAALAFLCRLG